ncbi:hypothetical protein HYH02_001312 [Chlamydomonas schloesseri]|uniref:Uncharacterized protein n=1 Tax=Chlamydomonas schloesseri TaxID=2026947 RepID=A0A836BCB8_9CHLO|nr:hypothetical protein HYH02_001312 [Chlamydomonas schloesseri]|eukprot:KAG2454281.1 hypothetical protein HYH02_001312 [Chlamydomonas schloesseri]
MLRLAAKHKVHFEVDVALASSRRGLAVAEAQLRLHNATWMRVDCPPDTATPCLGARPSELPYTFTCTVPPLAAAGGAQQQLPPPLVDSVRVRLDRWAVVDAVGLVGQAAAESSTQTAMPRVLEPPRRRTMPPLKQAAAAAEGLLRDAGAEGRVVAPAAVDAAAIACPGRTDGGALSDSG